MPGNRDALIERISALQESGTPDQILECLDELIAIDGETTNLLDYRFYLLGQLNRHEEALAIAEQLEATSERKSPWNFLRIAEGLIARGRTEEAFPWIERAVRERHFRRITAFESPAYDAVREDGRFGSLVEEATANIGLNREAKEFTLGLLDGSKVALSDFRGRVVLLDFWSIDCPPCVKEIPSLRELHKELRREDFVILGVNLDEQVDRVRSFVDENGMDWPMACSGKGWGDETSVLYDVQAKPSMWLIDKRGIVRYFDARGDVLAQAARSLVAEE